MIGIGWECDHCGKTQIANPGMSRHQFDGVQPKLPDGWFELRNNDWYKTLCSLSCVVLVGQGAEEGVVQ